MTRVQMVFEYLRAAYNLTYQTNIKQPQMTHPQQRLNYQPQNVSRYRIVP